MSQGYLTFKEAPKAFSIESLKCDEKLDNFGEKGKELYQNLCKKYRKIKIKQKFYRFNIRDLNLKDYLNINFNVPNENRLVFSNNVLNSVLPSDILILIGHYYPFKINVLSKDLYYNLRLYVEYHFRINLNNLFYCKRYLSAMNIKVNTDSLNYYYYLPMKKSPCGCLTKRKTFCKIMTYGNKKCRYHTSCVEKWFIVNFFKNYQNNHIETGEISSCVSCEIRVDPTDGLYYTKEEFLDFYGSLTVWNNALTTNLILQ